MFEIFKFEQGSLKSCIQQKSNKFELNKCFLGVFRVLSYCWRSILDGLALADWSEYVGRNCYPGHGGVGLAEGYELQGLVQLSG